jgi:hypothetical protein
MRSKKEYDSIKDNVEKPEIEREEIFNSRGKKIVPRKLHVADKQMEKLRNKFLKSIELISDEIKNKADTEFFNPYRQKGIYFGMVQALYLLGANEWHSFRDVFDKIRDYTSKIEIKRYRGPGKDLYVSTVWKEFEGKSSRTTGKSEKDINGRIHHNFSVLQRLGGINPYGYKLFQVGACIDIKNDNNGINYYKLRTGLKCGIEEVNPIKDMKNYKKLYQRKEEEIQIRKDIKKENFEKV